MLHCPFLLSPPLNHRELKWCRIGEIVFVYGRDVDHIILDAHVLAFSGQFRTVVVEVLHLDGYGPCGRLGGNL